ncbi:response regulator [Flagellimonas sp. HMM57]|uniref:response regulator transcription factor n=1 Tax=unclassified Flagellimonas TaxID=2644544 RepID=UPI0013D3DC3C|nr:MULTISPECIES: response regulator [unclassified Flagellimonas]UII76194.1 response regulator [Flagellimonas sp. HMM57]
MKTKLDLVIVDDSPLWCSIAMRIANDHPELSRPISFTDPVSALEHIRLFGTDLVITDMEMPILSGIQLINELKSGTMSVASSTIHDFSQKVSDLGCLGFLPKPYTVEMFERIIQIALMEKHLLSNFHESLQHNNFLCA